MADSFFFSLGRMTGVHLRKARWLWQSVAGSEADEIQAEHAVGRDMAAVLLEETPPDADRAVQTLLADEVGGKLRAVVRNRHHRFQMTCVQGDRPTACALPGGFIFVARPLVDLCDRSPDELAFVLGHEMAHVIRRHAIDRLLKHHVLSATALASPGRGALASWIRRVGFQSLERAYSRAEEFEADELGLRLMRAAGFDPAGSIRALERLSRIVPSPGPGLLGSYLSTHPPTEDRVTRLRRLVDRPVERP